MYTQEFEQKERSREELSQKAIALAMHGRWDEAVEVNTCVLRDSPEDLEACNRLGKALSQLGRNREAKRAFEQALEISPNNSIAKKNLERLSRLGDKALPMDRRSSATPQNFIEEHGKSGVTSLLNLASSGVLLKLAAGHPVQLQPSRDGLHVTDPSDEYVGQVEPKLASRLTRLIEGGNRYEATVISVGEQTLTVIIREVYRDPSQATNISFPLKRDPGYPVYIPSTLMGHKLSSEEGTDQSEPVVIKDWSDDDTEPGEDYAFSSAFHRIISASDDESNNEDEDAL